MSRPISIDSVGNRRIVAALAAHGPMTRDPLAKSACLSPRTLDGNPYYLRALLAAGRIHIKRWIRATELDRSGRPLPVYAHGPGKSAPAPTPYTEIERSRRWRKTPKYRTYCTRKAYRQRGTAALDPLLAALTRRAGE